MCLGTFCHSYRGLADLEHRLTLKATEGKVDGIGTVLELESASPCTVARGPSSIFASKAF